MTEKRRRQRKLIGELAISSLMVVFFGVCLVVFAYGLVSPADAGTATSFLIPILGPTGTLIAGVVVSLLFIALGVFNSIHHIRRLRDQDYLEHGDPTWKDYM